MARILVVDDDPLLSELLHALLGAAGYEVTLAADGRAGLDAALAEPAPDLVVLDLNLPLLDGFSVLEAIGKRQVRAPVLVLTARYSQGDADRVLALGAADFLAKPFSNMALLARIGALLRRGG